MSTAVYPQEIVKRAFLPALVVLVSVLAVVVYRHDQRARPADAHDRLRSAYQELKLSQARNGPNAPQTTAALNNLALAFEAEDRYELAEDLLRQALTADHNRPDAAGRIQEVRDLRNLAKVCLDRGRFSEAEPLLRQALEIQRQAKGVGDASFAAILLNLALVYAHEGNYDKAELLYQQDVDLLASGEQGISDPALIVPLNSLGYVYLAQGYYSRGRAVFEQALTIARKNSQGRDDGPSVRPLVGVGYSFQLEGKYKQAEKYYIQALKIAETRLGKEEIGYLGCNYRLATLYYLEGDWKNAEKYFEVSRELLQEKLTSHFPFMSESDKLLVLAKVREVFSAYESFCFKYATKHPELAGRMYDLLLEQKGLVVSSDAALRREIVASSEPQTVGMRERLALKKAQVAEMSGAAPEERSRAAREADQLEEQLAAHVSWLKKSKEEQRNRVFLFARERKELLERAHWQDIRGKLETGDAAIEYLHFPFHDGKRVTNTHYYVALIVSRTTWRGPVLVRLCDETQMEAPMSDYAVRIGMSNGARGKPNFYQVFWKPLEPELRKAQAKRIFLAPDGILNTVSFAVISDETGPPLLESYDLRTVSSTRDILKEKGRPNGDVAVLVGNPKFDLEASAQLSAVQTIYNEAGHPASPSSPGASRPGWMTGPPLEELSGTKMELDAASQVLRKAGWTVKMYPEEKALVEVVKRVHGPRLLVVATHGDYEPASAEQSKSSELVMQLSSDQTAGLQDPMLGSVLYFAGANRVKRGLPAPDGVDDGVLTAYEATELDLQGTELVVLSACESGLGKTVDGEGVFGLRRALQEAGSEAVMMSMWKLPDKKTGELMKLFYTKWVLENDKYRALREAQLEIRKQVLAENNDMDAVTLWGGLVLVGH